MTLYGVIMAGGSGTRFWPYSRIHKPKQLLKIFSDKSMMEETVNRLEPLIPEENIFISTNDFLKKKIQKEIPNINFVVEPMAKNTAACIGLSAITLLEKDEDAVMFIETADHVYKDVDDYLDCIRKAVITASKGKVVLIGIEPTRPHTGLGYIHIGKLLDEDISDTYDVEEFREKPGLKTAKQYMESGEYVWNSGTFISKCSVMLEEIKKHMPQLYDGLIKIKESKFDKDIIKEVFEELESISIDYGVMEKSDNTAVIKADMHWDDIGDFNALERWFIPDEKGNIALCSYDGNSTKCILASQTRKMKVNGLNDLIIADTPDATLICPKADMQNIKKMIEKIKEAGLEEYLEDYVKDYSKNIISHLSDDCEVETDGLIVLLNVSNLDIKRTNDELVVEGVLDNV